MAVFVLCLLTFICIILYLIQDEKDLEERMKIRGTVELENGKEKIRNYAQLRESIVKRLANLSSPPVPPERYEDIQSMLYAAGEPFNWKPSHIITLEMVGMYLGGAFILFLAIIYDVEWTKWPLLIILGAIAGSHLPSYAITKQIKNRLLDASIALPATLDLMAVLASINLSILEMASIASENANNVLTKEFQLFVQRVESGMTLQDSLLLLSKRLPTEDINEVYRTFTMENEMGAHPVAETLTLLSDTMRQRQQDKIRQGASAAQLKLNMPMMLLIFPAIVILLLGPMLVGYLKTAQSF
ncbi:type II secretion system F family protein [Anaeromusa acidaminophila]|uniref:type II secretion system F family protein n=1 Tax=Anaeromusa acidaminophila TaxID=81464 RepID=UPI000378BF22|nr:type II secretion system F family protein [Anaeromusa acidaminophila]